MMQQKQESEFTALDWWKKVVLENYTNFEGRARRKEFWMFQLLNITSIFVLAFFFGLTAFAFNDSSSAITYIPLGFIILYFLFIFFPSLAVSVRRLHDSNKSGWFYLIGFIPYIGGIIMLVFYVTEGTNGKNQYGPDPKRPQNEINEIGITEE